MKLTGIACFLPVTILLFLITGTVGAQSPSEDSLFYRKAVNNLIALYHQSSGDQSGIFNGFQYSNYPFKFTDGHPFFYAEKPGPGSVVYDGILYENLSLQFDEIQEAVIMESTSRYIQLLNQRISRFTLYGNPFIRIIKDSSSAALVRTGFYELLYEGNLQLLKREEKLIRDDPSTGVLLHFPDAHSYYYLKRNNIYYSINSKKGFFDLFKDRKKELRQYVRKNNLNYRKDRDNMLIKATAYYDQLIK